MSGARVNTEPKAILQARVFRIAWDRKPRWVPTGVWLWLGKRRISFTGRWENLGVLASTEDGSLKVSKNQ